MQSFIGHLTSRFIIHMVAWEWCIFQVMQEVCSHPSSHSENILHRLEEKRLSDCRLSMIISNQFLQDSWRQGSKAVDEMCHWNHHFLGHPAKLQLGMGRGQTDQGLQRWMEFHIWEPRFPPLQVSCGEAPGLQSSRGHCQPGGRDWSIPKKKKMGGLVLPIMHTKTSRTQVWCKIWQPFLLGKSSVTKNIQKSFHFEVMLWKWISFPPFQCDLAFLVLSPKKKVHHRRPRLPFTIGGIEIRVATLEAHPAVGSCTAICKLSVPVTCNHFWKNHLHN